MSCSILKQHLYFIGELIVFRRPSPGENVPPSAFTPCIHCLAFVRKHDLWRHTRHCPFNEEKGMTGDNKHRVHCKMQYESELLLLSNKYPEGCSEALATQVLSKMRQDEVRNVIKVDKLILLVGTSLLERGGSSKVAYVSQRMRTLARLLISIQELESSIQYLTDCIDPSKFDSIIKGRKALCDNNARTRHTNSTFSNPGLALNIGYDLHKVAVLL